MGLLDILKAIPEAAGEKARADEFGPDYRQRWQKYQDEHVRGELQNAISTNELQTKTRAAAAEMRAAGIGKPAGTPPEEAMGMDEARKRDLGFSKEEAGIGLTNAQADFYKPRAEALGIHSQVEQDRADSDAIRAEAAKIAAGAAVTRANRPASGMFGVSGAGATMTPEAIHKAALVYNATGQLPALGLGSAGLKTGIMNEAGKVDPNAPLALNAATYGANKGSLANLQKTRDTVGAYEQMSEQNMGRLETSAKGVIDTGFPPLNVILRSAARASGSEAQAEYDAARQVAVNEIARIVTSTPNLGGILSDTARHEVDAFNPTGATLEQSIRVLKLLKTEIQSRPKTLDVGIESVRQRFGAPTVPMTTPSKQGAAPSGAIGYNKTTNEYILQDGTIVPGNQ